VKPGKLGNEVRSRESSAIVEWVVVSLALVNLGALARRSFSSYSERGHRVTGTDARSTEHQLGERV